MSVMSGRWAGPLAWLVRRADLATAALAGTAAAVMVVVVVLEVVARYVFNTSFSFSNELARLLFVWTIFLGVPMALARGRHVGIRLVEALVPAAAARQVFRLTCLTSAAVMLLVLTHAWTAMVDNWDQTLNALPVSMSLFYAPMPIGMALSLFYLLVMAWTAKDALIEDDEPAEVA